MTAIKAIVHGLGNIGRHAIASLEKAPDFECLGVVRQAASLGTKSLDLRGAPEFADLKSLIAAKGKPDVALICGPSREVPAVASEYLKSGLNTVDSFDIHEEAPALLKKLDEAARAAGRTAVISAGWDPGTDSVLRALFEAMVPAGVTFTNFGRGRSMGHSVAVRAVAGVADATAITIPLGGGRHSRLVYVLPKPGAPREEIGAALKADPYFSHDPLELRFVETPEALAAAADNSHGVLMERVGGSGLASNQRLNFDMRIDNPALTAQVLVAAARASMKLGPGAHTLLDIPPVTLLPGDREGHMARLL